MGDSSDEYQKPMDKDRVRLRLESAPQRSQAIRAKNSSSLHDTRSRLSGLLSKDRNLKSLLNKSPQTRRYNKSRHTITGDNDDDSDISINDNDNENTNIRESGNRSHKRIMNIQS